MTFLSSPGPSAGFQSGLWLAGSGSVTRLPGTLLLQPWHLSGLWSRQRPSQTFTPQACNRTVGDDTNSGSP